MSLTLYLKLHKQDLTQLQAVRSVPRCSDSPTPDLLLMNCSTLCFLLSYCWFAPTSTDMPPSGHLLQSGGHLPKR